MSVFDFNENKPLREFFTEVALGNVPGYSGENKFGRNTDVDTASPEDVWDAGGIWQEPTGSSLIQVFSSSSNDSAAGSGAQTVTLQGLDSAFALSSESITLLGATRVSTTTSFAMVHRMFVTSAGSSGFNIGNITALNPTDTTAVLAQITATNNQTLMAIFQIPDKTTGLINDYYGSALKGGGGAPSSGVDIEIFVKPVGEVFQLKHVLGILPNAQSVLDHTFNPPLPASSKSIIKMQATTAFDDADITGGFDMTLKNGTL